ncbi:leukocyte elastase inhibitor-like [Macrosteles quadrilineatus]|uniref:leukocyte elastase inhibitor-like n=1 Tax=Macrosteles quadrilineatus TaxID=74068 RepID=UPI0023E14477|nr:leukocyte elastase inhibitor-like [Macrosteles quadrilineatus]
MWRITLALLFIAVPLQAMIVFENPAAANSSAGGFSYSDPYRERANQAIRRALADFTLRLDDQVAPKPGFSSESPNVVFSPLSIASVLALVLLGARGQTQAEVAKLLGVTAGIDLTGRSETVHEEFGRLLDKLEEQRANRNGTLVTIARGLFLQKNFPINQTFVKQTMDIYHTEVQRVDFQQNSREAQTIVNKWVENRTEGHIKNLLQQEPDSMTTTVIASALYFIGQWENPFYPGATKQKPFYVGKQAGSNHNEIINVDLMVNGADIPYYADPDRKCTIIGMPYKGDVMTMYVIVPDGDVKTFLDNTGHDDLEHLVKKTETQPVIFLLPKMRLESTINLVPPLRNMGIKTLFDSRTSNLTNIAEGVFVNEAVHKVEIDINESGTVAAAATAFTFTRDGSSPVVKVDKPFVFFIRHDETGIILFWGKVIKPIPHYPIPHD